MMVHGRSIIMSMFSFSFLEEQSHVLLIFSKSQAPIFPSFLLTLPHSPCYRPPCAVLSSHFAGIGVGCFSNGSLAIWSLLTITVRMGTCQTKSHPEGRKQGERREETEPRQKKAEEVKISFQKYSDEEEQMLDERVEIPHLLCPSHRTVVNVCTDKECKASNALFCENESCPTCPNEHQGCSNVRIKEITRMIEKRTGELRQFIKKVLEVEDKLFLEVVSFRKNLVEKYRWISMTEKYQKVMEQIYQKETSIELTPAQASSLSLSLREDNVQEQQRLLAEFEKESGKAMQKLNQMKEEIIQSISSRVPLYSLESTLIPFEDNRQIGKALQIQGRRPKLLKLLFRASEHQFLAEQFHKACDGVENTLTVIQTEPGKTILGFTPCKWQSPEFNKYVSDPSRQSFLMTLDSKQKMALMYPERAIYCNRSCGPIFGGKNGSDVEISDYCDSNENSYVNFPASYNSKEGMYHRSQASFTRLCGSQKGNVFKVVEYEVFKVEW